MTCGALQPMVCPHCQAESRPGSRTCSGCGKKLPVVGDGAVKFYKRKKTPAEIAAMVFLVLGAVLVLTAAVMFLMGTLSDVSQPESAEQVQEVVNEVPDVVIEAPVKREEEEEEPPVQPKPEDEEPVQEQPTEEEPVEEEPTEEEPVEEDPVEEEQTQTGKEWFFPDSSERLLTDADIEGMSSAELQIARNEIYARHGRRFNNPTLQTWFDSCSWYNGTIAPSQFDEGVFNDTELANIAFLKAAE